MVCPIVNSVGHFLEEGLILNFHFAWVVLVPSVIFGLVSSVTELLRFKHETGRTVVAFVCILGCVFRVWKCF